MEYKAAQLTEEQEKFLDIYLKVCPLRPEHKREDYPALIATNFITSMMKRRSEFEKRYEQLKKEGKIKE
jgi:hypothetical protein